MWVQSLSDYDQQMFEEEDTNRLIDSFSEWQKAVARREFEKSAIIVFLNKMDLLLKKFMYDKIPIKDEYVLEGLPKPPVGFLPYFLLVSINLITLI